MQQKCFFYETMSYRFVTVSRFYKILPPLRSHAHRSSLRGLPESIFLFGWKWNLLLIHEMRFRIDPFLFFCPINSIDVLHHLPSLPPLSSLSCVRHSILKSRAILYPIPPTSTIYNFLTSCIVNRVWTFNPAVCIGGDCNRQEMHPHWAYLFVRICDCLVIFYCCCFAFSFVNVIHRKTICSPSHYHKDRLPPPTPSLRNKH